MKQLPIPENVLLPIALKWRKNLRCDPTYWNDYQIELLRNDCGTEYVGIPINDVRAACERLRKAAKLGKLGGSKRGPARQAPEQSWYIEYLKSDHWQSIRERTLEFWGGSCACCCSTQHLEVHHRTYERLHNEDLLDVVPLCRACHRVITNRLKRQEANERANLILFG